MNGVSKRLFHSMRWCPRVQRRPQKANHTSVNQIRHNYDGPGKTTVTFLNEESDSGLIIDSYSQLGFRLNNGVFAVGPIALFPKSIFSWNVGSMKDVTPSSLELFFRLDPKIDILVLGMGDDKVLDLRLMKELKMRGLNVEALPTDKACTTFNFLNSEYRYVAAAMIPPETVRTNTEDLFGSENSQSYMLQDEMEKHVEDRDSIDKEDRFTKRLLQPIDGEDFGENFRKFIQSKPAKKGKKD